MKRTDRTGTEDPEQLSRQRQVRIVAHRWLVKTGRGKEQAAAEGRSKKTEKLELRRVKEDKEQKNRKRPVLCCTLNNLEKPGRRVYIYYEVN